jgi:hypothetical protein
MQRPIRNRLQSDGIVPVELLNRVVLEGFVEFSFSGSSSLLSPSFLSGSESAGQAMALSRSNAESIRDYANCGAMMTLISALATPPMT